MALAVGQYTEVADWFTNNATGTVRTVSSLSWGVGDMIVVYGAIESGAFAGTNADLAVPTNANLTFTQQAVSNDHTNLEAVAYIWTATAASTQIDQTISSTFTVGGGGTLASGLAVWVITGNPRSVVNATANFAESAFSLPVQEGSIVIVAITDDTANNPPGKTPLTGSGTANERRDLGNTTDYAQWIADWVGTAIGTTSFGPNNYTSLQVAQVAIEITAPAPKLAVRQYAQDANNFTSVLANGASHSVTGLAWAPGDIIVSVAEIADDNNVNSWADPANIFLTQQRLRPATVAGGVGSSQVDAWFAIAPDARTGQTITFPLFTNNAGGKESGAAVWVITGSPLIAVAHQNFTEAASSFVPVAGSVIINLYSDTSAVAAGRTILVGTGIPTERVDTDTPSSASVWAGDWVNVTADPTSYGVNSYAGMNVHQVFVEVLPTPADPGNINFTSAINDQWVMLGLEFTGNVGAAEPEPAPDAPPMLRAPIRSGSRLR